MPQRIAIIGGGLSGLSAAYHLRQLNPHLQIVLFEAGSHLGGVLKTENIGGYLVENSADMFTTEPADALRLVQRLGFEAELIATRPVAERAFLATPNGIKPVPTGFSLMLPNDADAVVRSGILDEAGAKRFLQEEQIPPRLDDSDESLESFAVRRFGQQVFDRLIQPLVSGIYTADPKKLSMHATLNRFVEMEQQHGSLLAAAKAMQQKRTADAIPNPLNFADQTASGARYDLFRAPKRGISQMIGWLVDALEHVELRLNSNVASLRKMESGWELKVSPAAPHDGETRSQMFDGIILATPASHAGQFLHSTDAKLASEIAKIETASCAVVVLGFDEAQFVNPFSGYGIVVPSYLKRNLIAASFSSNKFAGRASDGKVLVRVFIGGALQSELVDFADNELLAIALSGLDGCLKIDGSPELARVYRWRSTMPQYHVGHLERIARVESAVNGLPGLEIAGNSYNGVGIPVCIAAGELAAVRMNRFFQGA